MRGEESQYKMAWCKMEKKMTKFVPTESPKGNWVCVICGFRTAELSEEPEIEGRFVYI